MVVSRSKISSGLFYLIFFLTFLGFYAIVLVLINAGLAGFTRSFTIPVRGVIGIALIGIFLLNIRTISIGSETKWFLGFAFFYFCRIIADYYLGENYYLSTADLLFYFISFGVIPFVALTSLKLNEQHLKKAIRAFFLSGFIFSILAFLLYRDFVGQVGRLTSSSVEEAVVSPLILSYCSTLVVGVLASYLLYNKTSKWRKLLSFLSIALSIVPFFLGASRGSLLALFLPLLILLLAQKRIKIRYGVMVAVGVVGVTFLDEQLGSGLLTRFFSTSDAIDQGSSSAVRLIIWEDAFGQFIDHPFFGDKLRLNNRGGYAHNLFIEVLQTTGITGFIPFFILVIKAIRSCYQIFKFSPAYAWIAIIFLQSLTQNMFSGTLSTAAWFWTSLALVFATERFSVLRNKSIKTLMK